MRMASTWTDRRSLPGTVVVGGNYYNVVTDFRAWMKFPALMQDESLEPEVKTVLIMQLLGLHERILEEPLQSVFDGLFDFYQCQREPKKSGKQTTDVPYDYIEDWPYIYAVFRQQYGINLLDADLHWFEFKALFDSISPESVYGQIMYFRTRDVSKLPKSEQKAAQELKEYYRVSSKQPVQARKSPEELERELLEKARRENEENG